MLVLIVRSNCSSLRSSKALTCSWKAASFAEDVESPQFLAALGHSLLAEFIGNVAG
jgi:hypothetical protein